METAYLHPTMNHDEIDSHKQHRLTQSSGKKCEVEHVIHLDQT